MDQALKTSEQIEINRLLTAVAEYNASDLHLSVGNSPVARVNGELSPLPQEKPVTADFMKKLSHYLLNDKQRESLEASKEIVFSYDFQNRIRFKVNFFFQEGNLSASLRLISSAVKNRKELGLPKVVESFAKLRKGLILICGPYNSGRSSTLTFLINEINNTRKEHILTVERPIEFLYSDNYSIVEQREVGRDTISFKQALESAFQEDVDVIMISELKAKEEIKIALDLAEGGRLVFAAMETDSSVKTVERLINAFPEEEQNQARFQLAEVLEGIIVQRLVPRKDGGRVLVAEVLKPVTAVRAVIKEGNIYQINNILQTSREEGMISLDQALSELVKSNDITLEKALEFAVDKNNFETLSQRYG